MKKHLLGIAVLLFALIVFFVACPTDNDSNSITPDPVVPSAPVDAAFWFGETHSELIDRVGEISTDDYTGTAGEEMGQIATTSFVCSTINSKWGTTFQPANGTASSSANCEYLLKMIDKANGNITTFGTSSYATKQAVDTNAVIQAVNALFIPGGKFVAVSNSNNAAYSTDGINWTAATLSSSTNWCSVTYGNGKFVAVSNGNQAAYSTDGINWTASPNGLPSSAYWYSVTYSNGKFVAVSNTNKAAYSTDGINWTAATLPSSTNWYSVTYGNGKFVAVSNTNKAAYSTDGINWTAATLPSGAYWCSVTYGNGKFVAVGNGNQAAYSTDGINWTASPNGLPSNTNWCSVTYGNGKFVAVAYNIGNQAAYSTDGINWTAATLPSSTNWYSVAYGSPGD